MVRIEVVALFGTKHIERVGQHLNNSRCIKIFLHASSLRLRFDLLKGLLVLLLFRIGRIDKRQLSLLPPNTTDTMR